MTIFPIFALNSHKSHKICVFFYKIGGFGGVSAIGLTKNCRVLPLGGRIAQLEVLAADFRSVYSGTYAHGVTMLKLALASWPAFPF